MQLDGNSRPTASPSPMRLRSFIPSAIASASSSCLVYEPPSVSLTATEFGLRRVSSTNASPTERCCRRRML